MVRVWSSINKVIDKKNVDFVFLCNINDDFMKLKFYSNENVE
jgi:hypothetical protein